MSKKEWDDMENFFSIQQRINNMFQDLQERQLTSTPLETPYVWTPPFDVLETDTSIIVKAEVPGTRLEDLFIHLEDNVLTIKGERKRDKDKDKEYYHLMERTHGKFARSFTLPDTVNQSAIEAALSDGLLTVNIPKIKPKTMSIKVQ
ncbi:heat shock protein Hsp20 [Candidatus Magnetoovum chiemensis]|nr:heat shock protein Hsp20 [Candidatus Magnetoovum chiemensis]